MLIWSGLGILVPIIVFASFLLVTLLVNAVTGSADAFIQHDWAFTLPLIISAVICWFLGKRLNRPSGRVLIDKETGQEVKLNKAKHRLFFIKMEHWAPILILLGIIDLFA